MEELVSVTSFQFAQTLFKGLDLMPEKIWPAQVDTGKFSRKYNYYLHEFHSMLLSSKVVVFVFFLPASRG